MTTVLAYYPPIIGYIVCPVPLENSGELRAHTAQKYVPCFFGSRYIPFFQGFRGDSGRTCTKIPNMYPIMYPCVSVHMCRSYQEIQATPGHTMYPPPLYPPGRGVRSLKASASTKKGRRAEKKRRAKD